MSHRHLALAPFLLVACAIPDTPEQDSDGLTPRIIDGTEVTERNGAVQIRNPKRKADITDPAKPNYYCTGILIAENCVVTAGHCINEKTTDKEFVANADIWHAAKTNNNANGRPEPAKDEVVSKITAVSVLGDKHRDLAVIKLATALPGPTLVFSKEAPKLASVIKLLGNGQTAAAIFAHATGDMKLSEVREDPKDKGYSSLWLEQIGDKGAKANFGDSGGPALFGGGVVGVGSRLGGTATSAYYVNVNAEKSRTWLEAEIKKVCGLDKIPVVEDGGTTGGSGEESGDYDSGGSEDDGGGTGGPDPQPIPSTDGVATFTDDGGASWTDGGAATFTDDGGASWTGGSDDGGASLGGDDDPSWGSAPDTVSDSGPGGDSESVGDPSGGSGFDTDTTGNDGSSSDGGSSDGGSTSGDDIEDPTLGTVTKDVG